jgi:hypothetical protein
MRYLNKSWWLLVREPKARKRPRSESAVLFIAFQMKTPLSWSQAREVEVGLRSVAAVHNAIARGAGGCVIPLLDVIEALESETGATVVDRSILSDTTRALMGFRASWMTDAQYEQWAEQTRALDASHQASREWTFLDRIPKQALLEGSK